MAKYEEDREDMLLEGIAMPFRGQIRCRSETQLGDDLTGEAPLDAEHEIVIGWRPGGAASWYWNQDPVFQFNAEGQLRRAYFGGQRLSSEAGQVCQLSRRAESGDRVELLRSPLDPDQVQAVMDAWQQLRGIVEAAIDDSESHIAVVGCTPTQFRDRVRTWLQLIDEVPPVADNPDR